MKESVKRKIESYRKSNDKRPLVVDVSTPEELNSFNQEYATISKKDVYDLVKVGSEIPQLSDIHEYLGNCNEDIVILTGMGAYLRLMGKIQLNQIIHSIIATTYNSKFIIITYQCSKFFDEKDPRLKDKIIKSEENNLISSSIVFIDPKYKDIVKAENGLMNALRIVEKTSSETIYVTTTYSVTDFKDSLIRIEEYSSPYNLICIKDASLKRIPIDSATEEQWGKLLNKLKNNSVEKTIQEFIKYKDVLDCLKNWNEMSEFEQWLLFLYLKLYNTDVVSLAKIIMKDIFDTYGITATCGIGTNMYLAKIALDITAKHSSTNIGYLDEEKYKKELWHHKPLSDFWQIGKGIERRLNKLRLFDMYDIATTDKKRLYKEFGINAEYLIDHSFGKESCTIADIKKYKPKTNSITNSQILFEDYSFEKARIVLKEMVEIRKFKISGK